MLNMATIHRLLEFRFVIHSNDHDPAHVHLISGDGHAKVQLFGTNGEPEVERISGIRQHRLRRLVKEVLENREEFLKRWEEIHGKREEDEAKTE